MNVWRLAAPKKLVKTEEAPVPEEGKLRVRVAKVLVRGMDADIYSGAVRAPHPLIPGRFAVGMIAEETSDPLYPKGKRVLLHAFRPVPEGGTEKRDFTHCGYEICGQTTDGFLRDIVYLSPDEFTPLPDSVTDEQALFLHHVAQAKACADKLGADRGQHIAVIGADLFGILLSQLLIYQQVMPVLIDADEKNLSFAHECGIYYTAKTDDELFDTVASVTGGRMTGGAAFVLGRKDNDPELPFLVSARETNAVYCGFPPCRVQMGLDAALRKQIVMHTVCDCSEYLETAINLTVRKAVDASVFRAAAFKAGSAESAFSEPESSVEEYRYIDLI